MHVYTKKQSTTEKTTHVYTKKQSATEMTTTIETTVDNAKATTPLGIYQIYSVLCYIELININYY